MHFNRYLAFWFARHADEPALVCEHQALTWRELERQSGALAAYLRESGVRPGDRMGILLGNSLEWCVGAVACMRLGTILVPLNPMFGRFELQQIESDADCAAILSCPGQIEKLGGDGSAADNPFQPRVYGRRLSAGSISYDDVITADRAFQDGRFDDGDPLGICYTSGTTGIPKGAILSHRNIEAAILGNTLSFGWKAGQERFLILAPLAFTGGVISNLAPALMLGATAHIEKSVDIRRTLRMLTEHRITYFGGVPSLWERVAAAPGFAEADLSHLHSASTGGAPVPRPLMDLFAAKGVIIRQQYGVTEACGGVSSPDRVAAMQRPCACGPALPGVDLEIRNEAGDLVGGGEVGEIRVRGPQVMRGYWNKPDVTRTAFDGEWFMTGDLCKLDEDGAIIVVDRKKNMLISGGVNIYPAEVELALARISNVLEVVVLGVPSTRWGQEVAAIVHAPAHAAPDTIMAEARHLLGSYKAPKHIVLSPSPLPRTVTGKISRIGLQEMFDSLAALPTA